MPPLMMGDDTPKIIVERNSRTRAYSELREGKKKLLDNTPPTTICEEN